ncbi:RNA polymerase I-specific transcription initiation factor RRN3-like isoform X1 [Phoenix dactylifera]|uniref:RNA polymerase I-specific transcription initiation factor RRN3-like isoform X1 n=2 Tax=Phoenix dactylifera TaxID=42345 RepID=A0A8B9AKV0_PHODC|nr:RNA polymerase I-specific transcription initiation factor RRN3-like isoform X1 [Phoenix dactylifera]
MGVELMSNNDMAVSEMDDGYLSDTEAFSSVIQALDGVRMAPNLIAESDRDQYDNLLGIVAPVKKMGPDEEALLVLALKALSGAVSKIDCVFHGSLLNNIFSMCIWNYGLDARNALLELITTLAAVPDKFLDGCLHMLVGNFLPPRRLRESISQSRWLTRKKEVHSQLHMALHYIAELVPLAPMRLKDVIDKRMPRYTDPKDVIVVFMECMLGLESDEIGEFLGNMLLAKVMDLLTDLDVNISWEDILQEDHNKGIFDMELEEWEENTNSTGKDGIKPLEEANGVLNGNVFAEKLDVLMVIVCEHLKLCADGGRLLKVFDMLTEIFRRTIMNAHKSKFAQFVMFYACSLDPEICGLKFAVLLTDIFVSKTESPMSRMSAVLYLASYLSRAKFISSVMVASILKRLVDWCFEYCQLHSIQEKIVKPEAHCVFYSGFQAVMYVLCFRMRSIMDVPNLKSLLFHMPLNLILCHPLDPLKVCLPSIVQEFLRQAKAARLFNMSVPSLYDNLLESEFSKAFGGIGRLDVFFPFDPYLLKESDRFMRPKYEFWSMVKTTYSNCNSADEYEYEDLDAPDFADNVERFEGHDNNDLDSEDDLEYSINKMSITPKPAFQYPAAANFHIPSRMPARIRPSVSPAW